LEKDIRKRGGRGKLGRKRKEDKKDALQKGNPGVKSLHKGG